jgi:hypothetical protein
MRRIRVPFDPRLAATDAFGRAVTLLSFRGLAVELDELSVVDVRTEGALNGFEVGAQAVAGELQAVGEARSQVIDEEASFHKTQRRSRGRR